MTYDEARRVSMLIGKNQQCSGIDWKVERIKGEDWGLKITIPKVSLERKTKAVQDVAEKVLERAVLPTELVIAEKTLKPTFVGNGR